MSALSLYLMASARLPIAPDQASMAVSSVLLISSPLKLESARPLRLDAEHTDTALALTAFPTSFSVTESVIWLDALANRMEFARLALRGTS